MSRTGTKEAVEAAFALGDPVFCEYCGVQICMHAKPTARNRAVGDHRTPRARGGANRRSNIAVVCSYCDRLKGPLTAEEFFALRHDMQALSHMRATVSSLLNGIAEPVERSRSLRRQARKRRREERLLPRLREADPDCQLCDGQGVWWVKSRLVRCRCRFTPLNEAGEAS